MMRASCKAALVVRSLLLLVALLGISWSASGYPVPATVPYRWEMDFESGPLAMHVDSVTGSAYWYFTYKVTNRTGSTQIWAPRLTLFTDRGEIMTSGDGVPTRVEGFLIDLLGNELLEPQNQVIGNILVGPEHAKEGIAVWPAKDVSANEVSLFVRGISGESARVKMPTSGQEVVLYKTLHRQYLVPGDALARGSDPVQLVSEQWILR